ncbi:MAG: hypothetical protein AAF633_27040, partial [Chloroflexota bacterium]
MGAERAQEDRLQEEQAAQASYRQLLADIHHDRFADWEPTLSSDRIINQGAGIRNGNFEAGDNGDWLVDSLSNFILIRRSPDPDTNFNLPPYDGVYLGHLGGGPDEAGLLSQFVLLPEGSNFQIEYFFWILADETNCNPATTEDGDIGGILINEEVVEAFALCDETNTNGWVKSTIDLDASGGDILLLEALAGNNADSEISAFFVDAFAITFTPDATPTNTPPPPTATPVPTNTPTPLPPTATPTPSPTSDPNVTPIPTATVDQPSGGGELLNGDFEFGPGVGWVGSSDVAINFIIEVSAEAGLIDARSGTFVAALGGGSEGVPVTSSIEQSFLVPQPTNEGIVELSYYYFIVSTDICGRDFGSVAINGVTVVSHELCTEAIPKSGWVENKIDLTKYVGTTISLQFTAVTDAEIPSIFLIDDVSLTSSPGCIHADVEPNNLITDEGAIESLPDCEQIFVSGSFNGAADFWDIFKVAPESNMS